MGDGFYRAPVCARVTINERATRKVAPVNLGCDRRDTVNQCIASACNRFESGSFKVAMQVRHPCRNRTIKRSTAYELQGTTTSMAMQFDKH